MDEQKRTEELSGEPWRPTSLRPPKPGEYDAWVKRVAREKEELRQGRRRRFESQIAEEAARREAILKAPVKKGPSRFTTDAAIAWGRRKGWTFVERERWDALTRRHRDLPLAVDALFEHPDGGFVGIQGAGRREKAAHRSRFEASGGAERARRRGVRVVYVEFVRGNPEPVLTEWWA